MEKKKEETKKVPVKNYLIVASIMLAFVLVILYLCNWYNVYDDYQKETPIIRGTLSEITSEELDHFIMENPSTVIYMCSASEDKCRSFEKDFVKLIEQKSLQEVITYVNLSDIDVTRFVDDFNNIYKYKTKLTSNYPAIVVFEDGKITKVLQGSDSEKLTITKTKQFIDLYDIGE